MHYVYYKDSKAKWRWRLKTANGRMIADSGEGYSSESECPRRYRSRQRFEGRAGKEGIVSVES